MISIKGGTFERPNYGYCLFGCAWLNVKRLCLENARTMTKEYFAESLDRLNNKIKEKLPHLAKKKFMFHLDNALAHKDANCMNTLPSALPSAISLGFTSSDFFRFSNVKKWLNGKTLQLMKMLNRTLMHMFLELPKSYCLEGIQN